MIYRNLLLNDRIPESLDCGMPHLTPELTWVAVDGMKIVGVLIGFAAHGVFQPFRVITQKGIPSTVFMRLCRKAFSDMRARGCETYVVCLMNESEAERHLYRILGGRGTTFSWEGDSMMIGGAIESILSHGIPADRRAVELRKVG